MPAAQLSLGSLEMITDHFSHLAEFTIYCDSHVALGGNFHLYYNSLVQRGINVAVKRNNYVYYFNFAHPDMGMVKRTLITNWPFKVDLLLQQEHQLPPMLEALVAHARGSGGFALGLRTRGLWFVTNQIVTSNQDVQRLLTSLKHLGCFGIWRGAEEEVKESEVETMDKILTMLANKEKKGKLDYVQLPKALLLKSDKWVEHLGGEGKIEEAAKPSTNYFPWGGDCSVGVMPDFANPASGRLLL